MPTGSGPRHRAYVYSADADPQMTRKVPGHLPAAGRMFVARCETCGWEGKPTHYRTSAMTDSLNHRGDRR